MELIGELQQTEGEQNKTKRERKIGTRKEERPRKQEDVKNIPCKIWVSLGIHGRS